MGPIFLGDPKVADFERQAPAVRGGPVRNVQVVPVQAGGTDLTVWQTDMRTAVKYYLAVDAH